MYGKGVDNIYQHQTILPDLVNKLNPNEHTIEREKKNISLFLIKPQRKRYETKHLPKIHEIKGIRNFVFTPQRAKNMICYNYRFLLEYA